MAVAPHLRVFFVGAPVVRILLPGDRAALGPVSQHHWSGADQFLPIRNVPLFLDDLGGIYPSDAAIEDSSQRIEVWLLQLKNNRRFVGGRDRFKLHPFEGSSKFARFGETAAYPQHTVIVDHDILGRQSSTVQWGFLVPMHALADFDDIRQGVGLRPAFRQLPFLVSWRAVKLEVKFVSGRCPVRDGQLL